MVGLSHWKAWRSAHRRISVKVHRVVPIQRQLLDPIRNRATQKEQAIMRQSVQYSPHLVIRLHCTKTRSAILSGKHTWRGSTRRSGCRILTSSRRSWNDASRQSDTIRMPGLYWIYSNLWRWICWKTGHSAHSSSSFRFPGCKGFSNKQWTGLTACSTTNSKCSPAMRNWLRSMVKSSKM